MNEFLKKLFKLTDDLNNSTGFRSVLLVNEIKDLYNKHISNLNNKFCIWKRDEENNYLTKCSNLFTIINGTPKENNMKYCPYCGNKIKE